MTSTDNLFGQRLQHCAEKDHPHCYEEAKISGQRDLFMLSALQILFLTSRKHLIATLPRFTRSLALLLALDRVRGCLKSPGRSRLTVRGPGFAPAVWKLEWGNIVGEI